MILYSKCFLNAFSRWIICFNTIVVSRKYKDFSSSTFNRSNLGSLTRHQGSQLMGECNISSDGPYTYIFYYSEAFFKFAFVTLCKKKNWFIKKHLKFWPFRRKKITRCNISKNLQILNKIYLKSWRPS